MSEAHDITKFYFNDNGELTALKPSDQKYTITCVTTDGERDPLTNADGSTAFSGAVLHDAMDDIRYMICNEDVVENIEDLDYFEIRRVR